MNSEEKQLIEDILAGKHDGEYFYICDYRIRSPLEKPLRNVRPQRVLIRSNKDVSKTFYYSESHAVVLGKSGTPLKRTIPLVDNTGWKTVSGDAVSVSASFSRCNDLYYEMRNKAYQEMQERVKLLVEELESFNKETNDIYNENLASHLLSKNGIE